MPSMVTEFVFIWRIAINCKSASTYAIKTETINKEKYSTILDALWRLCFKRNSYLIELYVKNMETNNMPHRLQSAVLWSIKWQAFICYGTDIFWQAAGKYLKDMRTGTEKRARVVSMSNGACICVKNPEPWYNICLHYAFKLSSMIVN